MTNSFTLVMMVPWAIIVALLVWVQRAQPENRTFSRYPWSIRFLSVVPFYHAWEARVAQNDLRQFVRYRRRHIVFYFSLIAIVVLQTLLGMDVTLMRHLFPNPGTQILVK